MIRVGFIFQDNLGRWNGGLNYYKNLVDLINGSNEFEPYILASPKLKVIIDAKFPNVKCYYSNLFTDGSKLSYVRKFFLYYFKYEILINRILKKYKIDIVSHNDFFPLNKKTPCPCCSWIPDLQSFRYPQLFSEKAVVREKFVRQIILDNSKYVVVSSYDSKKDLKECFPKLNEDKIKVFHFTLPPINKVNDYSRDILDKYKLDEYKFFLITNQFWAHKNHIIVLKSLKELLDQYKTLNFKIVATGLQKDSRDLANFNIITNYIKENQLQEYFIMTGNIPYNDVKCLQYYSTAVIQPSLFEGWNTAVEECKLIGKKIILSNIPVHLEQNPANVEYFNPHDEIELAKVLKKVFDNYNLIDEKKFESIAETFQESNWNNFKEEYIKLIKETLGA